MGIRCNQRLSEEGKSWRDRLIQRGRERGRESLIHRRTQRHTQRHRYRQTQTHTHTHRDTHTQTHIHTHTAHRGAASSSVYFTCGHQYHSDDFVGAILPEFAQRIEVCVLRLSNTLSMFSSLFLPPSFPLLSLPSSSLSLSHTHTHTLSRDQSLAFHELRPTNRVASCAIQATGKDLSVWLSVIRAMYLQVGGLHSQNKLMWRAEHEVNKEGGGTHTHTHTHTHTDTHTCDDESCLLAALIIHVFVCAPAESTTACVPAVRLCTRAPNDCDPRPFCQHRAVDQVDLGIARRRNCCLPLTIRHPQTHRHTDTHRDTHTDPHRHTHRLILARRLLSLRFFRCRPCTHASQSVKMTSSKRPKLPYPYYFLPYCRPQKLVNVRENLGEVLRGDRITNTPYEVRPLPVCIPAPHFVSNTPANMQRTKKRGGGIGQRKGVVFL